MDKTNAVKPQDVLIVTHHHSDLLWRRTKRGYDRVRDEQILQALDFLREHAEFRFTFAQTEVVRTFLAQHPDLREEFRALVAAGRIELVGGMVGIPDTNLVCGESLVRNLVLGRRYMKRTFGVDVQIGWLMDAFGMSAQLPQIFVKSGFTYLYPGRMPGLPDGRYRAGFRWAGLDGTEIVTACEHACIQAGSHVCNLPITYTVAQRVALSLDAFRAVEAPVVFGLQCTEEGLFEEEVFDLVRDRNADPDAAPYRFAVALDYYRTLDPQALPGFRGELNPEFTGCYTSHIRIKELNRAAEGALLTAEAALSIAGLRTGLAWPAAQLDRLWERVCLWQFHDSICGCHADAVMAEACDDLAAAIRTAYALHERALTALEVTPRPKEKCVTVFNSCLAARGDVVLLDEPVDFVPVGEDGAPLPAQRDDERTCVVLSVPGAGFACLRGAAGTVPVPDVITDPEQLTHLEFETAHYRVEVAEGVLDIRPRCADGPVFVPEGFAELVFREDRGGLWTEEYLGTIRGREHCCERVERVIRGPVFTRVCLLGHVVPDAREPGRHPFWDGFEPFAWEKEITFFNDLKWFHVALRVIWSGRNTEVGLRFPLRLDPLDASATYAVPYGHVERPGYYEVESTCADTACEFPSSVLRRAKGNWPALGWVDYADSRFGVTVANRGTPAHRLQNGAVTAILLRSPTGQSSGFVPQPSSWENGQRTVEFALLPHAGGLNADCVAFGEAFNRPLALHAGAPFGERPSGSVLAVDAEGIVLAALKRTTDGECVVVRLREALGRDVTTTLTTDFPVREQWLADLNETPLGRLTDLRLRFGAFEVKTLLLRP